MSDESSAQHGLAPEELEQEQASDLPEREAMSILMPPGVPHVPLPPVDLPDGAAAGMDWEGPPGDPDTLPPEIIGPAGPLPPELA